MLRRGYLHLKGVKSRLSGAEYPDRVAVETANQVTLDFIKTIQVKTIAEIGIYKGHTSLGFAEYLNGRGELHLFDYEDKVRSVARSLRDRGYTSIVEHPNSSKTMDSYNWSLMNVLEVEEEPIFDYVFLDGAHTWNHDALAFLLVDRLLKPQGYIDFDDNDWTLASSPSLNPVVFPKTRDLYTSEQIEAEQVNLILKLLVRRDPRYREVVKDKIFKKVAASTPADESS
jgi:predicted O-methyltransferase YrrM